MRYFLSIYLVEEGEVVENLQQGETVVVVVDSLQIGCHHRQQAAEVEIVVCLDIVVFQRGLGIDDAHELAYILFADRLGVCQLILFFLWIVCLLA